MDVAVASRQVPLAVSVPAGAETSPPSTQNPFTARSRVVEALLDLQAVVPMTSALLTVRHQPAGPDRPIFAYGAQREATSSAVTDLDPLRGMTLPFKHGDRVIGSLHVRVAVAPDDDARGALRRARDVLEEEVVAFVRAGDAGLSERELEVVRAMAAGATNREIASQLHLSLNTVKTHVERILAKLGASNRIQAVRAAARAGLV